MQEGKILSTKVGLLSGIMNEKLDKSGMLRSCTFSARNEIIFHGEVYIPRYREEDCRTRSRSAVKFYEDGKLKSIYLDGQQEINTPIGKMKAEMVSFYESGRLLRVFPVFGQISGFWSEEEEAELLSASEITIASQIIKAKISCFHFHESGNLKSVTLWPGERINVMTPVGKMNVRLGISFYENGAIESVEPSQPTGVMYQDCKIYAYDNHPIGVHGDSNSLCFYEDGNLKALKTSVSEVLLSAYGKETIIKPEYKTSLLDLEEEEIVPIKLEFQNNRLLIFDADGETHDFSMEEYQLKSKFILQNLNFADDCKDCSTCNKCAKN